MYSQSEQSTYTTWIRNILKIIEIIFIILYFNEKNLIVNFYSMILFSFQNITESTVIKFSIFAINENLFFHIKSV